MEEENKVILAVEADVDVDVELPNEETDAIETFEEVSVETHTEIEIDVTEVAGAVSGVGTPPEHNHEITEIGNLSNILNKLGSAHEIYSTGGGIAEFRQWLNEDKGIGYFVGLVHSDTSVNENNTFIDICDKENVDVYGVTVLNSGMCGYQDERYCILDPTHNKENALYSDPPYAKVCLLGVVNVRVYTTDDWNRIAIGDYVVPDEYGCAAKSDNNVGFRVISRGNTSTQNDSWHYVTIALVPQNDNLSRVMKELEGTRVDLENVSLTIGDLTNKTDIIINEKLKEIDEIVKNTESSVNTKLETTQETLDKVQDIATQSQATIDKVSTQYTNALGSITEARDNANSALEDVSKVREDMEYFINNKSTIAGFFAEDSSDQASLGWLLQKTTENGTGIAEIKTEVDENGVTIRHLASYADRYTIGKYSPTYKLSYAEAIGALDNKEYIYVPTKTGIEKSHIYNCSLNNDIEEKKSYVFDIENITYLFNATKGFKYNYEDTSKNIISFNLRKNELTIGEDKFHVSATTEITEGAEELTFESEWTTYFTIGNVYVWTKDEQDNSVCHWKEIDGLSYKLFSGTTQPDIKPSDNGGEGYLWYCANGVLDDGKIIYQPGTLYRWTAYSETTGVWIAVATVNDGNSRTMSYIEQTEESITSTVTNVQGDISSIKQTVNEIKSSVSDGTGMSSINQTAKDIAMGIYQPNGKSSSLEILLSGLQSTAYNDGHLKVGSFDGDTGEYVYYSEPPTWGENGFEFKTEPSADGEYYFNSDKREYYCKKTDNTTYDVYTIGNQAMANLSTRVDDTESSIESWTKFQTDVGETISSITQSSTEDAAEILSMVFGSSIVRDAVYEADEIPVGYDAALKYKNPPIWKDKQFTFEGQGELSDGAYFMLAADNNEYYYKLLFNGEDIVGCERYKLKSQNYSSIMQKVDDTGSHIGFVAGNKDVDGGIFVDAVNNQTSALIQANKITLNGETTFESILSADRTTICGDHIKTGSIESTYYHHYSQTKKINGLTIEYNVSGDIYYTFETGKTMYTDPGGYSMQTGRAYGYIGTDLDINPGEYYCPYENEIYKIIIEQHDIKTTNGKQYKLFTYLLNDYPFEGKNIAIYQSAESVIKNGEASDFIYCAQVSGNTKYSLLSNNLDICYIGESIEVDSKLNDFDITADTNGFYTFDKNYYIVSTESFSCFDEKLGGVTGTKFDLNNGSIVSKNFILDGKGNVFLRGSIINNQYSFNGDGSKNDGVYVGNDGIGLGNGNFYVQNNGDMYINNNAYINGNLTFGNDSHITWDRLSDVEKAASSAQDKANSASLNISCLANGEYSGSFINERLINAPYISGGTITGTTIQTDDPDNKSPYITMNKNGIAAYVTIFDYEHEEYKTVRNGIYSVPYNEEYWGSIFSVYSFGQEALSVKRYLSNFSIEFNGGVGYNESQYAGSIIFTAAEHLHDTQSGRGHMKIEGFWDFSGAQVYGLDSAARFG